MSLAGRAVLVTRPRELAHGLAKLVEDAGGRAIVFPAIEIVPLKADAPAVRYDVVVFVSPTAVRHGAPWIAAGARVLAVGAGTARELTRFRKDVTYPPAGADSEALLALPELANVAGMRIAIVRGEGGRALLGDTLRARGAQVRTVECYRRVRPGADPAPLLAAGIDALTVSSGEALDNLLELAGEEGRRSLRKTPLFVPHERVAAHARNAGAREVIVAGASDGEMIARLVAYFSDERERAPR